MARLLGRERGEPLSNAVGTQLIQEVELCLTGWCGSAVGEIDDVALGRPRDCRMRGFNEALQALRQPMVTARLPHPGVHALLDDDPFAVIGDDEAVEVKIEPILD